MKKLKLFIAVLLLLSGLLCRAMAGNNIRFYDSDSATAYLEIESDEILDQNGSFDVNVKIFALDTTVIEINPLFKGDSIFTIQLTNGFNKSYILPGDSALATFTVSYDPNDLPYYPKQINFYALTNPLIFDNDTSYRTITTYLKVYFTPYGTTELWDITDFVELPRVWEIEQYPEPSRISIYFDSIPVSTKPTDLDSNSNDWEFDFQLVRIQGLPYSVQMAAAHPDSIAAYIHRDSTETMQQGTFRAQIFPKRFYGTVTGRLAINILNDEGATLTLHPSGVKVRLKEDDLSGNQNGLDLVIAHDYTDNGFFTLNYDVWQSPFEGNRIELYLEFVSENNEYDIQVIRNGFINYTINECYKQRLDIGSVYGQDVQTNIGDILMGADNGPFRILHFAYRAFQFCDEEIQDGLVSKHLNIKLFKNSSYFEPVTTIYPVIRLETGRELFESTIHHEFGHFAMWRMQGSGTNWIMYGFGKHVTIEESNHRLARTEGWAHAFSCLVDIYAFDDDNEWGLRAWTEGGLNNIGGHTEFRNWERRDASIFTQNNNNGVRSEFNIACAINDLYDGADKFSISPPLSKYAYIDVVDPNNPIDPGNGYDPGFSDEISLTAYQICQPIIESQNSTLITNVFDYYQRLREDLNLDCNNSKNLKIVFDQNDVIIDIQNNEGRISSDEIEIDDFVRSNVIGIISIADAAKLDVPEINTSTGIFNLATSNLSESKHISDDLEIIDQNISLNINTDIGWIGSGQGTPPSGSQLTVNICANNIIVHNNGKI